MARRRTAIVLGVGLAVAVAVAVTGTLRAKASHGRAGSGSAARALSAAARDVPRPPRPAFAPGRPVRLAKGEQASRSAAVMRAVVARRRPSGVAGAVARLALETPEATTNIVVVLGEATRPDGQWVHVRLPALPNGQTAWVPRRALGGYRFLHTRLVVDRERLRATLLDDGRAIFQAPVGVGRSESPTPSGEFYIRDKVNGFGNPFYGPIAYGTSARSAVLTDWPGGGFVGIHGTNEPDLIPGHISHGCIRMRNPDILRLSRLMPVGTPLTIE